MLTPDACASPQVKEEIDYAQSIGRKIYPILIKRVETSALEKPDVESLNYTDFNTSYDDRFAWSHLLKSLPKVSRHEEHERPDPDNPRYMLHQSYLKRLLSGSTI